MNRVKRKSREIDPLTPLKDIDEISEIDKLNLEQRKKMIFHTLKQPRNCLRIPCFSRYRSLCFTLRKQMILSESYHFNLSCFVGVLFVVPVILSTFLVQQALIEDKTDLGQTHVPIDNVIKQYNANLELAFLPVVVSMSILLGLTMFTCMSHLHDTIHTGLLVWNRDNLGIFIQYLVL